MESIIFYLVIGFAIFVYEIMKKNKEMSNHNIIEKNLRQFIFSCNDYIFQRLMSKNVGITFDNDEIEFLNCFFDDMKKCYSEILIRGTFRKDQKVLDACKNDIYDIYLILCYSEQCTSKEYFRDTIIKRKQDDGRFLVLKEGIALYKVRLISSLICGTLDTATSRYAVKNIIDSGYEGWCK